MWTVPANFRRTHSPSRLAWSERERDVYWRDTQANRRTIVHQSCSLYSNNQMMKYILEPTRRSVYIHQLNRVNSRDDFGHDDSIITIGVIIIIIIIF